MRGGQHLEPMVVEVTTCVHDLGSWYEHMIGIGPYIYLKVGAENVVDPKVSSPYPSRIRTVQNINVCKDMKNEPLSSARHPCDHKVPSINSGNPHATTEHEMGRPNPEGAHAR